MTDSRTEEIREWAVDPIVCISNAVRERFAYLLDRNKALEDVADAARALRVGMEKRDPTVMAHAGIRMTAALDVLDGDQ